MINIGKKTNKKNYALDLEEKDYQIELDKVQIKKIIVINFYFF